MSTEPENTSAETENEFHVYTTNRIPLWVRILWVCFWAFAIYYAIQYAIPAYQVEWLAK